MFSIRNQSEETSWKTACTRQGMRLAPTRSITDKDMRRYELHSTLALNMGNIKPFSQSENDHTVLEVKSVTKNTRRKTIVSVSWEDVGHRPDRSTTRFTLERYFSTRSEQLA